MSNCLNTILKNSDVTAGVILKSCGMTTATDDAISFDTMALLNDDALKAVNCLMIANRLLNDIESNSYGAVTVKPVGDAGGGRTAYS